MTESFDDFVGDMDMRDMHLHNALSKATSIRVVPVTLEPWPYRRMIMGAIVGAV